MLVHFIVAPRTEDSSGTFLINDTELEGKTPKQIKDLIDDKVLNFVVDNVVTLQWSIVNPIH